MLIQVRSLIRKSTFQTLCVTLIIGSLILVGCQQKSVTDSPASDTSTQSSSNGPSARSAGESPATGDAPAGQPVPSRDENGNAVSIDDKGRVTNLPITVSPAKPMMTPAPDPFPARPTPSIVMKDGKIVQQWEAPAESKSVANPVGSSAAVIAAGKEFYSQRCVDCHGKDGKGNGWLSKGVFKPPTNLASRVVQDNTDGELFWKITNGRSPMPANRIRFTDEQRWQIVSYIRTFKP